MNNDLWPRGAAICHSGRLVGEAWLTLLACVMTLRLIGFRRTCMRLAPHARPPALADNSIDLSGIHRAVHRAARLMPRPPNCLQKSLTVWRMLVIRGAGAKIHFGVRPNESAWELHAWVQCNGRIVNDRPDVATFYRPLLPADPDGVQDRGLHQRKCRETLWIGKGKKTDP